MTQETGASNNWANIMRKLDLIKEQNNIENFIRAYLKKCGLSRLLVGISGGIDSAVTAALSVKAIGKDNVIGVRLPYLSHSSLASPGLKDAQTLIERLGIKSYTIDISAMVDSYCENCTPSQLRKGNFMARIRMCILYDLSAIYEALVAGTGNKSELLTGYATQYGDNACAFEPIGHLYKTEVRTLAELLHIPEVIREKAPSADLWESQTDEEEMGISYPVLDEILYLFYDLGLEAEDIIKEGFNRNDLEKVIGLYNKSAYKREMPPIPELVSC